MKSNRILMLAASLIMSLSSVANTNLGYTNETVARNNTFRFTKDTDQRLAIKLPHEKLQLLKGKTISGIRAAFGSKNSTNNEATLFLATSLDDDPIETKTVTISGINKFLDFTLDTPYVITGEEEALYIGFTMTIAASYGPFSSDFSQDIPGVNFAYGNGEWQDLYGKGYGCANIEAVIDGDLDFTDLVLKPYSSDDFMKENTEYSYTLELQNFGTTTINAFDTQVKVGDDEARTVSFSDLAIEPHKTYTFTIDGVRSIETGNKELSINISFVNGNDDADESDNVYSNTSYFYPAATEKNVLIEGFTSQTCSNCPTGHSSIASAIQQSGVGVVELFHHSGYVDDIFSMNEDWTMTGLYNGSTYAPAAMVDRAILVTGETTPVFDPQSISKTKTRLQLASSRKPYVSMAVESKYDVETKQVDLKAHFYTHEQMPSDNVHYTIWLVQDSLIAAQSNGGTNYVHNAVSRGCITEGSWGEKAEFKPGEVTTIEKTFVLPDTIVSTSYTKTDGKNHIATDLKNMKLLVFVHEVSDAISDCSVFNIAEVHIGESLVQGGYLGITTPEKESTVRKLVHQTYYGDAQGYLKDDEEARKTDYLYDSNNRLIRAVEISSSTESEANDRTWDITHYYKYEYDANGNLIAERPQTYGVFDYGSWGMIASKDSIRYEYNDKDQLTKETHANVIYEYTYDEQGRKVTCSKWNVSTLTGAIKNDLVETYSDFNSFNEPCTITATSPTGKSWNEYTGTITYDERGNKLCEKHYKTDEGLCFHEEWEYDGDFMTKYINYSVVLDDNGQGIDSGAITTTYTRLDADGNKVLVTDDSGVCGTKHIDEYTMLTDGNDYTHEVFAEKTDESSVRLSFDATDTFNAVTIYRNGIKIAEHYVYQTEYNSEQNKTLGYYDDKDVRNGEYEYVVVLEKSTADGFVSYNCSDVVPVTFNRYLPVATNLHVVSIKESLVTQETTVVVGWTNPEIDSSLGFEDFSIYTVNSQTPEQTSDVQNTNQLSVLLANGQTELDVFVQINYKYGRANSEIFHIDTTTGIKSVCTTEMKNGKFLKDGNIYIIRNGKTFTVEGVEKK